MDILVKDFLLIQLNSIYFENRLNFLTGVCNLTNIRRPEMVSSIRMGPLWFDLFQSAVKQKFYK